MQKNERKQIITELLRAQRPDLANAMASMSKASGLPEIRLNGMERMKLLSAFQVLQMPEGAYKGATHDMARKMIKKLTGVALKKGMVPPPSPPGRGGFSLEDFVDWLDLMTYRL